MKKTVSAVPIRMNVVGADFHYYLSGPVGEAAQYVDLIDILYSGKEADTVYIHLNTPGGSLDTTIQILNAIKASNATVITVADGVVASAGTLILLSGHSVAIQPFSYAMFHDGAERMMGKLNENLKQANFAAAFLKKLYHEVYNPFLSKKEIDDIIGGKDLWLTAEELTNRLKKQEKEVNE